MTPSKLYRGKCIYKACIFFLFFCSFRKIRKPQKCFYKIKNNDTNHISGCDFVRWALITIKIKAEFALKWLVVVSLVPHGASSQTLSIGSLEFTLGFSNANLGPMGTLGTVVNDFSCTYLRTSACMWE